MNFRHLSSCDTIVTMRKVKALAFVLDHDRLRRLMARGPDNVLLKKAILLISVFLSHFSMKFGTELESDQYDSFK